MDIKTHFQNLLKQNLYTFKEFLNVYRQSKQKDQMEILKFLFGPGRDSKYIPHLDTGDINLYFNILLTNSDNPSEALIKNSLNNQVKVISEYIKSHTGKLVNPNSSMSLLKIVNKNTSGYFFTSDNIKQKRFAYAGNAMYQKDRLFLEAHFYFDNKLTSFLDLIATDSPLLSNIENVDNFAFLLKDLSERLSDFQTCKVTDEQPQTFYPLGDDKYLSLTILPSFAMLNQIKVSVNKLYEDTKDDTDLSFYVKRNFIKVGGAQPQNVSSFNSDNGGVQQVLENITPFIKNSKKISDDKIFYHHSLIKEYSYPIKLNLNLEELNRKSRINYLEEIIENFLLYKLEKIIYIVENIKEYKQLIETSKINSNEREYILHQSKKSSTFDYFYDTLNEQLLDAINHENNLETSKETFLLNYKNILKNLLGEIL